MMTAKEYLSRAYRLNERINSYLAELDDLRALACSISSPSFEEKYGGTRPTDPPFVRAIEKIDCLEREISLEIEKLISVKKEINEAIRSVPDNREQALLRYRYINNYTWEKIGVLMDMSERTASRMHGSALSHFKVPEE